MKPLSIQLYTVRELTKDNNHIAVLKELADIGYKGVEGFGYGLSVAEWNTLLSDLGMETSSYFAELPTPETVDEFIETAKELKVKNTVAGFWIPDFESVDAIAQTADKINGVLPAILDAGLTLSLHNHWFEYEMLDGKFAMQHLLDRCSGLTLEIDIYWAAAFGQNNPADVVSQYKAITPLLHVKDGPLVKGEPHVAVGSGKVDISSAIQAADPNLLDWLIVELDECATDMMTAVRESYQYLVGNGLASGNKPVA